LKLTAQSKPLLLSRNKDLSTRKTVIAEKSKSTISVTAYLKKIDLTLFPKHQTEFTNYTPHQRNIDTKNIGIFVSVAVGMT